MNPVVIIKKKFILAVALVATASFLFTNVVLAEAANLEKIKGRWQRSDGNYMIEIQSINAGGKLKAYYFNPASINVAKAEVEQVDQIPKIYIELRDTNYPGSAYKLNYDKVADRLVGSYFQAVEGQTYEVLFERLKQ